MYKSGLIIGVVALGVALGVTLISPVCVPCLALLLGLGAGFLAGVFDKSAEKPVAIKSGAIAGAIAGAGLFVGQTIGVLINGFTVGPEGSALFLESLGLSTGMPSSPEFYWAALIGGNFCMAIFSVALMAGLGALGGMLWWQTNGKNQNPLPPEAMPQ